MSAEDSSAKIDTTVSLVISATEEVGKRDVGAASKCADEGVAKADDGSPGRGNDDAVPDDKDAERSAEAATLGSKTEDDSDIREQIEFYFSDANLPTDMHMLQKMKQNKEGFVSLAHIATFSRMKKMLKKKSAKKRTTSKKISAVEILAAAIDASNSLKLSADRKSVTRVTPFDGIDMLEKNKRTCQVQNLPQKKASVDEVKKLFGEHGTVLLVTFVDNKADKIRVEFESEAQMLTACEKLNDVRNWRGGLRVTPLMKAQKKLVRKSQKKNSKRDPSNKYYTDTRFHPDVEGKSAEELGWGKRFKPRMPRRQRLKLKARRKDDADPAATSATGGFFFRSAKGPDGTLGFACRKESGKDNDDANVPNSLSAASE